MDTLSAILFLILFVAVFGISNDRNVLLALLASIGSLSFIMSFFTGDYFLRILMMLLGLGLVISSVVVMRA
jgi:hypothetical protein